MAYKTKEDYHHYYNTAIWKRKRATQLRLHPLCSYCLKKNIIKPATVAHHVTPHKGNWELFINSFLESLCKVCHDSVAQSEERLGFYKDIDDSGWPIDVRHPAFKKK